MIDVDDDNDGVPDSYEITCNTYGTRIEESGTQHGVGTNMHTAISKYSYGSEFLTANVLVSTNHATWNLTDAMVDGSLDFVAYSTATNAIEDWTINMPANHVISGNLKWGPNLTNNTNTNYNSSTTATNVIMTWEGAVTATMIDPDNQTSINDGTIMNSGDTFNRTAGATQTKTWYINFVFSDHFGDFTMSANYATAPSYWGSGIDFTGILACKDNDMDGDGIFDRLDLDSDGDGCFDAYESGVTGATNDGSETDSLAIPAGQTTGVGANGFSNALETAEDGIATYNSSYGFYGISSNLNLCSDFDNDGVPDLIDLDDDNDGVLDGEEAPTCFYSKEDWLMGSRKGVVVSTSLAMNATYRHPSELVDGDNGTAATSYAVNFIAAPVATAPTTVYQFDMPLPIELSEINLGFYNTSTHFAANTNIKLQGSFNGSTWIDLNNGFNYATTTATGGSTSVPGITGTNNNVAFTVDQNGDKYAHYRLYWTGGGSINANWILQRSVLPNTYRL